MKNRHGSYKKILMPEELLGLERASLVKNIEVMKKMELLPYEFCTLYILLFLRIRHPKNWLQKKKAFKTNPHEKRILDLIPEEFNLSAWEKEKLSDMSVRELYEFHNLKGIPLAVNRTMINWLNGLWNITLLTHIPSPRELLRMQVKNTRCITLTVNSDEIDRLVLSSRDPLSFVLHDLHHADCFFNQKEVLKGQLGFYNLVDKIYDQPLLKKSLKSDQQFKSEFDYVVSDMNAYVIHLFKCFKSAFTKTDMNLPDPLFPQVLNWWQMPAHVSLAAERLNTPHFQNEDERLLTHFFENSQEVIA